MVLQKLSMPGEKKSRSLISLIAYKTSSDTKKFPHKSLFFKSLLHWLEPYLRSSLRAFYKSIFTSVFENTRIYVYLVEEWN